jgi:hypothetical protein
MYDDDHAHDHAHDEIKGGTRPTTRNSLSLVSTTNRVYIWYIFEPTVPVCVNFGGSLAQEDVDILYGY